MLHPHLEKINGHEFSMIPIKGSEFLMGSPKDDPDASDREFPQHPVKVSSFYLGQYPVTQALWKAVMNGENPSRFQGDDRPVERVSWKDAQDFIQKLNAETQITRPDEHFYCLPSEAAWEYAARGGHYHADGYQYAGSDRLKEVGWFDENSDNETKPVGLKYPNQLGLYDMSGNVYEWCEDDWHDHYEEAPKDGSAWIGQPNRGAYRVVRGGYWYINARDCCAAYRGYDGPGRRGRYIGFRLALAPQLTGRHIRSSLSKGG